MGVFPFIVPYPRLRTNPVDNALNNSINSSSISNTNDNSNNFPRVRLDLDADGKPTPETSRAVTSALRDSGFLVVETPLLPPVLQRRALEAADAFLQSSSSEEEEEAVVVTHPSDPKVYAMFQGIDSLASSSLSPQSHADLRDWYEALRRTRDALLRCIAAGLDVVDEGDGDADFFVRLHDEDNDALRLLRYPPGNAGTGNRCKEHSDYGTLTLLLNDGVGGLEAHVDGEWKAVPYEPGCVVVNIGSLLSEWTGQELKATLHRVAGPASRGSATSREALMEAVSVPRVSIAYFSDPNGDVSTLLASRSAKGDCGVEGGMSVSEYIRWRSGGEGAGRSGVAYTSTEQRRVKE